MRKELVWVNEGEVGRKEEGEGEVGAIEARLLRVSSPSLSFTSPHIIVILLYYPSA